MIRKANLADVPAIHRLVESYAKKGRLLHRTMEDVSDHIRCFSVAGEGERIMGCSALHVYGADLAEIKSLAVDEQFTRQGWGAKLVRYGLQDAAGLGIGRVFALTYETHFFETLGFVTADKQKIPAKIWRDCMYCQKYDDCDEVCVEINVVPEGPSAILPVTDR
jgi:amino-acid N-acetyltransferase